MHTNKDISPSTCVYPMVEYGIEYFTSNGDLVKQQLKIFVHQVTLLNVNSFISNNFPRTMYEIFDKI